MTATEIINEIDKLSADERQEVRDHFWESDFTVEESALIEQRCIEDDAHPERRVPWELAKVQIEEALQKRKQCA